MPFRSGKKAARQAVRILKARKKKAPTAEILRPPFQQPSSSSSFLSCPPPSPQNMNTTLKSIREEFNAIEKSNNWESEFKRLSRVSRSALQRSTIALRPENQELNRYNNVFPFDDTRVVLQRTSSDYINASHVSVRSAKQSYILTQGPLEHTVPHFWAMVWEQDVSIIVMLNKLVENNSVKCKRYWPSHPDLLLNLQEIHLQVSLVKETSKGDFIKRIFELTDKVAKEKRTVVQLHYQSWPDFGTPHDPSSFLRFVEKVRQLRSKVKGGGGGMVVHCSAGIGRSGTFCLVDACLSLLQNKPSLEVSPMSLLLEMRDQRMELIQTPEQLRFSYIAIMEGAKALLRRDDSFRLLREESSRNPSEPSITSVSRKRKLTETESENKKSKLTDSAEDTSSSTPNTKK